MSEPLRVAILGAAGTIAPAIVRDLGESEEAGSLELLDLDGERAAAVAEEHGAGKASARAVDARSGLASALEGVDVLVNSASYRLNLDAMRACLEAGCHYLDLGGLYWMTGRQLELNEDFERAGLLAVLGIGSAPGKTNVLALRAAHELGQIERLDVSAAGRDLDPPAAFSLPYSLQTLLDELTMAPVVLRDGEPVELEPLADGGAVDFGDPIGSGPTVHTLHSELRTFGESFGCREASFRLSLSPTLLERLRELTEATEDEIHTAAADAVPASAATVSVHVVDAADSERTVRARAITRPLERWGLGGGVVSTASPAAAVVRLLARGRLDARGVLPPERCLDPDDLFAELETRGAEFSLEELPAGEAART